MAVCTPAEKELPAPAPAPADAVSHTPAATEVVLPPASVDGVASDAIAPGYIPDSTDVAASPAPLPALADEATSASAPVEAAYRTSAPVDEPPEPVSDVCPDFGTAEHGVEECPSRSDIRYVHTNRLKEVPRDGQLAAEDTPRFHKIGYFPWLTPPPCGWLVRHCCCAAVGLPLRSFWYWIPERFGSLQNGSQLNARGCANPSGQDSYVLESQAPPLRTDIVTDWPPPSATALLHPATFRNASTPWLAPFTLILFVMFYISFIDIFCSIP